MSNIRIFAVVLAIFCCAVSLQGQTAVKPAKEVKIGEVDKNMVAQNPLRSGVEWYSIDSKNMKLDGLHWRKTGEPLRRIPLDASVSKGVDSLSWNTAGVMLRFKTNAKEIRLDVQLWHAHRMDHMTYIGSLGFDIYQGSGTAKYYRQSTRITSGKNDFVVRLFGPVAEAKMREFTIHFPLYAGVKDLKIGLTPGAVIEPPTSWADERPIVVYGSSIQQGGCASRPGMCHTNQLSRMLNRPFLNFGFSGSGKGEPAMAQVLADIKNPAMYILDYDANARVNGLRNTLSNVINIIRAKHPETPILLVSRLPYASEFGDSNECTEDRRQYTEIHLKELQKRRAAGDKNIHFLDGTTLYGDDPTECTVDGVHGTDLGFYMVARRMAPVIRRILNL